MGFLELLLIGVGLSMDAFAVAVCQGLCMPKLNLRYAAVIALFFGGFQALMPYAGWLLGAQFAGYIQHLDHWLAFFLLAFIGGKMVWESLKGEAEETACAVSVTLDYKQLLLMAVATSIDALAVGVTFAFLNVDILPAVTVIGCTTFVISLAGVVIGTFFGARLQRWADLAYVSYYALDAAVSGSRQTLGDTLMDKGVFTVREKQAADALVTSGRK